MTDGPLSVSATSALCDAAERIRASDKNWQRYAVHPCPAAVELARRMLRSAEHMAPLILDHDQCAFAEINPNR